MSTISIVFCVHILRSETGVRFEHRHAVIKRTPPAFALTDKALGQPITDLAHALQVAEVPAERFARFKHGETRVWDAATSRLVTEAPKEKARPRNDALAAQ